MNGSAPLPPTEPKANPSPGRRLMDRAFEHWIPVDEPDNLNWLEDADRAMLEQDPVKTRKLLYVIILVVISLITWSAYAQIDEVTRGEARVIPSRQVQIIQSQDGGVVTELAVAEGDIVEPGQLLVKLDATRSVASFRENRAELIALQVKAERLRSVAEEEPFYPTSDMADSVPEVVEQEMALFSSSMEALEASRSIARQQLDQRHQELVEARAQKSQLDRSYNFAAHELEVSAPLLSSGAVSEIEVLRLRREVSRLTGERAQVSAKIQRILATIAEAENRISEVSLEFKNDIREELSRTTSRINTLTESSRGLLDRVEQTAVVSPVKGTVKQLFFNTIGGVILPGRDIAEIVPADDALLLEAKINPRDIAFLRPGQEALVKFTAYDFIVYGGLKATVEHISADTVVDENGVPFYIVRVRTLESEMGEGKPIIPGMVAEVDILTGKKSILHYMLKPVFRARQYALTER
ncbi:HlyD family type I secretion periplasmic adaptor subunit [Aliamphritea hakodatensis]|uniref:HlyD family type I secretion periplasmic adaptor subunit n=1 Tax=Aliamphritea hakodatensis TaxID=2895352 RepID=UPI0022FD7C97|nr:HlyD family type I secretion periplasmic adaptor subunit [Aliamphritea hakodatensis]